LSRQVPLLIRQASAASDKLEELVGIVPAAATGGDFAAA